MTLSSGDSTDGSTNSSCRRPMGPHGTSRTALWHGTSRTALRHDPSMQASPPKAHASQKQGVSLCFLCKGGTASRRARKLSGYRLRRRFLRHLWGEGSPSLPEPWNLHLQEPPKTNKLLSQHPMEAPGPSKNFEELPSKPTGASKNLQKLQRETTESYRSSKHTCQCL